MEHAGALSLVPAAVVFAVALSARRTFEALVVGCLAGFVLIGGGGFFGAFVDSLLAVMGEPTTVWIILVVGLFGALIAMLIRSGGALAFGRQVSRRVRGRRGALLATFGLGTTIFLDDYLNALTVGSSMRRVTDRFGVSREMLAYVVDSTAAPICVLVPMSTWSIFVAGLLEQNGVAPEGAGLRVYISTIPYMVYAWVALVVVALVALGRIPVIGPMRTAEARAAEGSTTADSPGAAPDNDLDELVPTDAESEGSRTVDFILPLAVMVVATWWFEIDALKGVVVAVAFTVAWLLGRRILGFGEASEAFFKGVQTMVYPLGIVVMSFVLKDVNDRLGLTEFVIESVRPVMWTELMPAVAFLALSFVTFATGSFWGVYAIALPIVIPLAQGMGVSMPLAVGAVVSAGAFGSHSCFYGDATVLSSASAGCDNIAHAVTQFPYALIAAVASAGIYVVLGFTV